MFIKKIFEDIDFQSLKKNNYVGPDKEFLNKFIMKNYFHFITFSDRLGQLFQEEIKQNNIDKNINDKLHPVFFNYFIPFSTPGDGNCLWHMISKLLCGNISMTSFLKNFTALTILIRKCQFIDIIFDHLKSNNANLSN